MSERLQLITSNQVDPDPYFLEKSVEGDEGWDGK